MSFCLRSILNKFTFLVNTRRQVTQLDHQLSLSKRVKSSLLLKKILGMQTKLNVAVNFTKSSVNSLISLLGQNVPVTFFDRRIAKSKIRSKKYSYDQQRTLTLHRPKETNVQALNVINSDPSTFMLKNSTQWIKPCMDPENRKYNLSCTEITSTKRILDHTSSSSKMESILYSKAFPNVQDVTEKQPEHRKSPAEQLQNVFKHLERDLPSLFVKTMDYSIYTKDLIFINNIKGTTTTDIQSYVKFIALLKIVGHIKYAYIKCDVLKMTMHPEDNTIKVRWRIEGISGTNIFLKFWKFSFLNAKEQARDKTWYDGFSTFYVNNDGKIFKHIVDKMMPDHEQEKVKTPVEPKLALFVAVSSLDLYFDQFYLQTHHRLLQIK